MNVSSMVMTRLSTAKGLTLKLKYAPILTTGAPLSYADAQTQKHQ